MSICKECGEQLYEVVECSECGCYCIECYEQNENKWYIAPMDESENHCYNLCHNCVVI